MYVVYNTQVALSRSFNTSIVLDNGLQFPGLVDVALRCMVVQ